MDERQIVDSAQSYIEAIFSEDYSGHDVAHSLRVYRNAMRIAQTEPQCNRLIVSLAALLHDVDDHKLFHTENNEHARSFLVEHNVESVTVEKICEVINGVSYSQNQGVSPKTIEGKIVQDADRLDAMGAIGIARTFAYGGAHGRSIEDSMKHFDEKLLFLKNAMNTEEGRSIASSRHDFLETFVDEIREETDLLCE